LATFIHHIFVKFPEGQYVLKLIDNFHNLVQYSVIKYTLRAGNAATMINAMVNLTLAKVSLGSVTNWVGLTKNADDGMNMVQMLIWRVLKLDAAEFTKVVDKVRSAKSRPPDNVLDAIKQHVDDDREDRERVRSVSQQKGQSIIMAILDASEPPVQATLTDDLHTQCLDYYSALLSVRDRDVIKNALCRQTPDLLTQMIRDGVGAYEPIIRAVHNVISLSEHLDDTQAFIDDFIKTSKPRVVKGGKFKKDTVEVVMPSVEDYIDLFMRNRDIMYKWLHALASKCPDVWEQLREWTNDVIANFRKENTSAEATPPTTTMEENLGELFASLPPSSQESVLAGLDAHADYLAKMAASSHQKLQHLVDSRSSNISSAASSAPSSPITRNDSMSGPGVYLSRWNELLDRTPITPFTPKGPVRRGRDVKDTLGAGKTAISEASKAKPVIVAADKAEPEAPDVGVVVRELGPGFLRILQRVGGPRENKQ
jgi:hypothetical protein